MTSFHDRVLTRAWMTCAVLALIGTAVIYFRYTPALALSFLLGAVVAIVNLRWLEYSVAQIMDVFEVSGATARSLAEQKPAEVAVGDVVQVPDLEAVPEPRLVKKRPRTWHKLVLRYVFLGGVAYAILIGRFVSVGAFLAGLFLPVVALMLEAVYEAYAAFKSQDL
ncbi:MAG: hypothetical protein NVS9B15_03180 [Acidobacteriaceae bacterium]